MLRAYCDICRKECDGGKSTTRRFEHLGGLMRGEEAGLEIIFLANGVPSGDAHVCDECLLMLVWKLAERCPGTGLAVRQKSLIERESTIKAFKADLDEKHKVLTALEAKLISKEQEVTERERAIPETAIAERDEKIKLLEAQMAAMAAEHVTQMRILRGQYLQKIADDANYPEYRHAVDTRERTRHERAK